MTEPNERLNAYLDDRRIEQRMTWDQVAQRAGLSTAGLRSIRSGRTSPSRLTAAKLDEALGLELGTIEEVAVMDVPRDRDSDLRDHLRRMAERDGIDVSDAQLDNIIAYTRRKLAAEAKRRKSASPRRAPSQT